MVQFCKDLIKIYSNQNILQLLKLLMLGWKNYVMETILKHFKARFSKLLLLYIVILYHFNTTIYSVICTKQYICTLGLCYTSFNTAGIFQGFTIVSLHH